MIQSAHFVIRAQTLALKIWSSIYRVTIEHHRRDGQTRILEREVTDHGAAVAVLPFDARRDRVLLVRQYRAAATFAGYGEPLIEACAGLTDGDAPEAAMLREAREELGYNLKNPRPIGAVFVSPGALTERIHLYLADFSPESREGSGGGLATEGEDIEVLDLAWPEVLQLLETGQIADAKTMILIQALALEKLKDRSGLPLLRRP